MGYHRFVAMALPWLTAAAVALAGPVVEGTIVYSLTATGSITSQRDSQAAVDLWVSTARTDSGADIELNVALADFSDLAAAAAVVREPSVIAVGVSATEYLDARALLDADFAPAYVPTFEEGTPYVSVQLLTSTVASPRGLAGLAGATAALTIAQNGPLSRLWLDVLLARAGLSPPERFFGSMPTRTNASRGILDVFFGSCGCCMTDGVTFDTMLELNPAVGTKLAVLARSEPLLGGMILLRRSCTEAERRELDKLVSTVGISPKTDQILKLFRIRRIVPYRPEYLEPLARLYDERERLRRRPPSGKGRSGQPKPAEQGGKGENGQ